jgi:hypothetical protein
MGLQVAEEVQDYKTEAARTHAADTSSLDDTPAITANDAAGTPSAA